MTAMKVFILVACFLQIKTSTGSINEMFSCAVKSHGKGNFFEELSSTFKISDSDVKYFLFKSESPYPYQIFLNDESRLRSGNFDVKKPTKIIIHGYRSSVKSRFCNSVKDSFFKSGDFNVIIVDWERAQYWGPGNKIPLLYPAVVKKVNDVASSLMNMIRFLENYGMSMKTTTLVGHSLGAHIAGIAGYNLKNVHYIVGLDPARPLFAEKGPTERLSKGSATHVEVIHTEITNCGLADQLGHYDFYPNSGLRQPGCSTNKCSHSRSYHVYAESLLNTSRGFYGKACPDWKSMTEGRCNGDSVVMGAAVKLPKPQGIFYVKTNDASPYALGP